MRVLHCLDTLQPGGTELNAVRVIESLDPQQVTQFVVCLRAQGPLVERLNRTGVPLLDLSGPEGKVPPLLERWVRVTRLIRARRINIVHAHDTYSGLSCIPPARLATKALTIASRRWWHTQRARTRVYDRITYAFAHSILANSPLVGESLATIERVPRNKIVVIPNFVAEEAFAVATAEERLRFRSELSIPAGALVVMSVSRLVSVKNHSLTLRAFAGAVHAMDALHLVFVGDGPARSELENEAAQLGLQRHVTFAGWRPNTPNPYSHASIAVLSSRREGFPNTLLEAMAAGVPLVARAVGGVPDLVRPGITGMLVGRDDPLAMSQAILDLATDRSLREHLGAECARVARQEYHQQVVIPLYYRLYRQLLEP